MIPDTYNPDDDVGVRHDTLVEARIEVDSAIYRLRQINVELDALADDREGIWTADQRTELREMQRTAQAMAEACETDRADLDDKLASVKAERRAARDSLHRD